MANNENEYFTTLVDGQLSVRTVAQTGDIIPEENKPADKYTTALVQTSDGPQLCVKTYDLNGGGGGGTVDQTYDATSTNAQSGTAVAEAVQPYLKNTATGQRSLGILSSSATNNYSVSIGETSGTVSAIATVIGAYATVNGGMGAIAIGGSDNLNYRTKANKIGAIAIGSSAGGSVPCEATAQRAIQLGIGTNSTADTFQVYSYPMLDGTTGKIPMARLPIVQISQADYDALVSGGTVDANTLYLIV